MLLNHLNIFKTISAFIISKEYVDNLHNQIIAFEIKISETYF